MTFIVSRIWLLMLFLQTGYATTNDANNVMQESMDTTKSVEQQGFTYDVFLIKTSYMCILKQQSSHALVSFLLKLRRCTTRLWHQCLKMNSALSNVHGETWFPCNKGIIVNTKTNYHYTVKSFKWFHIKVTFLKFDLHMTWLKCVVHSVTVR